MICHTLSMSTEYLPNVCDIFDECRMSARCLSNIMTNNYVRHSLCQLNIHLMFVKYLMNVCDMSDKCLSNI